MEDAAHDASPEGGVTEDPLCDDLDPCTLDTSSGASCTHTPAPNGTLCTDDDACTLGDRCMAGACVGGPRSTGTPQIFSIEQPTFRGTALGVGAERFLFFRPDASGTEVLLARANGDELALLDRASIPSVVVAAAYWLGNERVAYADGHHFGLLDTRGDHLLVHASASLTTPNPYHFAATEDRLWMCTSFVGPSDLVELDASHPSMLTPLRTIPIDGEHCRALYASSDGQRVYVAKGDDTLVFRPGAAPVSVGFPSQSVHVGAGVVTLSTASRVVVLRESDHVEIGRVSARVVAARTTSRGLEIVNDRDRDGGTDRMLSIYALHAGSPPTLVAEERVVRYAFPQSASGPGRWASQDDALLDGSRVFSLSASAPFVREIRDDRRFWPYWLRAAGTMIYLRDDNGAVALDVHDPAHPFAVAGGEFDAVLGPAVEIPAEGEVGLYGVRGYWPALGPQSPRALYTPGVALELAGRAFDDAQRPADHARHAMPSGTTWTFATYRNVYAAAATTTSVKLSRYAAGAFSSPMPLAPLLERTFAAPASTEITSVARVQHDAAFAFVTSADLRESDIHWVALDDDVTVSPLHVDVAIHDLVVHGDRIFALGWHSTPRTGLIFMEDVVLLSFERRGAALEVVDRVEWTVPKTIRRSTFSAVQVLRFDGHTAYAQLPFGTRSVPSPSVVAFDAADLDMQAVYELPSATSLWSATESDVGLVFGGPSGITIVRPSCR